MLTVTVEDVPEYLQESPLYLSVSKGGEHSTIEVPDGCLRQDASIDSNTDLREFINTLLFWQIPSAALTRYDCLEFVLNPFRQKAVLEVLAAYEESCPELKNLKSIVEAAPHLQMEQAARLNALYAVQYLFQEGKEITIEAILAAAETGSSVCLRCLLTKKPSFKRNPCIAEAAAEGGHVGCLQFSLSFDCKVTEYTAAAAAKGGSLECLIMLRLHQHCWDVKTARMAAYYGHLDCLKYTCEHLFPSWGNSDKDFYIHFNDVPACAGQLECLRFMQTQGYGPNLPSMEIYVLKDHTNTLRFLLQHLDNWFDLTALLETAVRHNTYQCVEVLVEHMAPQDRAISKACEIAATLHGKIEYLIFFITNGFPWDLTTMNAAARAGNVEAVSFLRDNGCDWGFSTTAAAAAGNDVPCLSFLHENGCPWNASTCIAALEEDAHECLAYALDNGCSPGGNVITQAISQGKYECLRYLIDVGKCTMTTAMPALAAGKGSILILRLLHEKGCPWDERTCAEATTFRQWECFAYAYENGCPCELTAAARSYLRGQLHSIVRDDRGVTADESLITRAVKHTTALYLRFVREDGQSWSELITRTAAAYGTPVCLRYALANGCPAPADLATIAAEHGQRECLDVAVEMGYTLTNDVCLRMVKKKCMVLLPRVRQLGGVLDAACALHAVNEGDLELLRILHRNGALWNEATFRAAVTRGDYCCVQYMFENNCPLDFMHSVTLAAQHGHTSIVVYLRERRLPWDSNTCCAAAGGGHLSCLKHLHENGCPWDAQTTIFASTQQCLDYAVENGCPNMQRNLLKLEYGAGKDSKGL